MVHSLAYQSISYVLHIEHTRLPMPMSITAAFPLLLVIAKGFRLVPFVIPEHIMPTEGNGFFELQTTVFEFYFTTKVEAIKTVYFIHIIFNLFTYPPLLIFYCKFYTLLLFFELDVHNLPARFALC